MFRAFGRGVLALAGCGALLGGCGPQTLETGYHPRPLNSTSAQRRAFYASPFAPEANLAEQERKQSGPSIRPSM